MPKFLINNGSGKLMLSDTSTPQFFTSITGKINTIINVNESDIICTVPSRFVGHSTSHNLMCNLLTLDSNSSKLSNALSNLGATRLRIGGSSTSVWSPDAPTATCKTPAWRDSTFNKTIIDNIVSFVQKMGYELIFELNVMANNPVLYSDEALYIYSKAGSSLKALAFGNEPDITDGLTYSQYKSIWESYRTAIISLEPNIPLEGLENSYYTDWLQNFVNDEYQNVKYITQHYYPLSVDGTGLHAPTITNLLSELSMRNTVDYLKTCKSYTDAVNIPLAIGESNSTSGGGFFGVSNTLAASLWFIDHAYSMMELGMLYINLHGLCGANSYSIISDSCEILPMYYGLLFFHQAVPDGTSVKTTCDTYLNVKSHSTIGTDGNLRVAIINKDLYDDAYINVNVSNAYSSVKTMSLKAPLPNSSTNITFGDAEVASDGTWNPTLSEGVPLVNNMVELTVPHASATLLTFFK